MTYKYPTLKEAFLTEIDSAVADEYVSKMKLRNNKSLYKKLYRLSKTITRLYNKDISPTRAAGMLKTFSSLNPEINPLKDFDTMGIKMFIHNQQKDSKEVGKEKRYYENVIQAFMKNYL